MRLKSYNALSNPLPPPQGKCATSLTGDINLQSSYCNNGRMKIAYNSAYVQIATVNFTFTRQAVIVYFSMRNITVQAHYFFANNFVVYINSPQKLDTAVYIH